MKMTVLLLSMLLLCGCDNPDVSNADSKAVIKISSRFTTADFDGNGANFVHIIDKQTGCEYLSRYGGGIVLLAHTCKDPL